MRLVMTLAAIMSTQNHAIIMTTADIHWTFHTALTYGGRFYKSLAAAGLAADPANRERLLRAFPELQATYGPQSSMHRITRCEVVA